MPAHRSEPRDEEKLGTVLQNVEYFPAVTIRPIAYDVMLRTSDVRVVNELFFESNLSK